MGKKILAVCLILVGLGVFSYPAVTRLLTQREARQAVARVEQMHSENTQTTLAAAKPRPKPRLTQPQTVSPMEQLFQKLRDYNRQIYEEGQINFRDPFSYEAAPIDLTEYGFEENVIATIWIPRLDVELPVYLGATAENMAKGVALLGQTSLPVSGENTNVVIAGHRGWRGTPVFRDIQKIQLGDKITLTTPWETLCYRVCELEIIDPSDTQRVLIQPDRELLTLLTCHPYTQNYQRYLVRAERSEEESTTHDQDLQEAGATLDERPRMVLYTDAQGDTTQMQVDSQSIQPVADEGMETELGAAYSNRILLLEKYLPPVIALAALALLVIRLLAGRRK